MCQPQAGAVHQAAWPGPCAGLPADVGPQLCDVPAVPAGGQHTTVPGLWGPGPLALGGIPSPCGFTLPALSNYFC